MMAFSFLYNVFGISVEAKDVVKRAVVFIECCLGRASLLYTSSFITDEVNL